MNSKSAIGDVANTGYHHCGPACDEDALADAATIEEVTLLAAPIRRCVPFHDP
jgi:hypothetical protein